MSCIFIIILMIVYVFLFLANQKNKNFNIAIIDSAGQLSEKSKQIDPKDLGTVSSAFGFSLKYPFKETGAVWGDDEKFQAFFFFPPALVSADERTVKDLSSDIHNLRLSAGLEITVIETEAVADFLIWVKDFIAKEDIQNEDEEKVLSEKTAPITFAGLDGYQLTRQIEGSKHQLSPHYVREEIFVHKNKLVYRIRHLASSDDSVFPRSGVVGKKYLQQVDILSREIIKTFSFDESITMSAISVPKIQPPQLSEEASVRRENLLAVLRKEPFFDKNSAYPILFSLERCSLKKSSQKNENVLTSSPGIYISISNDEANIHAYDEKDNHTGSIPPMPMVEYNMPTEEHAQGIRLINLGSLGRGLSIRENINGRIELVGKKFSIARLVISGEGNSCLIAEMDIPVTPYSIAILPMTIGGDFGPISYDIDGDGTQDFMWSLVHPLLPAKQLEISAVIEDMMGQAGDI